MMNYKIRNINKIRIFKQCKDFQFQVNQTIQVKNNLNNFNNPPF